MYEQAYLVACYMLGERYHSGQFSKGYRLLCMAEERGRRNHSAWSVARSAYQLREHKLYRQGGDFRRAVAYMLNKLRKYRHAL